MAKVFTLKSQVARHVRLQISGGHGADLDASECRLLIAELAAFVAKHEARDEPDNQDVIPGRNEVWVGAADGAMELLVRLPGLGWRGSRMSSRDVDKLMDDIRRLLRSGQLRP